MSMPRIPPSQNSPTPPRDAARLGLRAKTIATRLTPEELHEVESAAERDGKSLAEWLRETALRSGDAARRSVFSRVSSMRCRSPTTTRP